MVCRLLRYIGQYLIALIVFPYVFLKLLIYLNKDNYGTKNRANANRKNLHQERG
jgi:hypothetical protein